MMKIVSVKEKERKAHKTTIKYFLQNTNFHGVRYVVERESSLCRSYEKNLSHLSLQL